MQFLKLLKFSVDKYWKEHEVDVLCGPKAFFLHGES